jgi:hypothetical protein
MPINGILRSQMRLPGEIGETFTITPPKGVTIQEIMKPSYWAQVAQLIPPMSKIDVLPEDNSWEAELRVVDAGKQHLTVRLRHPIIEYEAPPVDEGAERLGFKIEFNPLHKWRVVRTSDREIMAKDFVTREAAAMALHEIVLRAA